MWFCLQNYVNFLPSLSENNLFWKKNHFGYFQSMASNSFCNDLGLKGTFWYFLEFCRKGAHVGKIEIWDSNRWTVVERQVKCPYVFLLRSIWSEKLFAVRAVGKIMPGQRKVAWTEVHFLCDESCKKGASFCSNEKLDTKNISKYVKVRRYYQKSINFSMDCDIVTTSGGRPPDVVEISQSIEKIDGFLGKKIIRPFILF